jgi:hypothetical protein
MIFLSDKSSLALLDHASFYYTALSDDVEGVKKNFAAFEVDMTKFKE